MRNLKQHKFKSHVPFALHRTFTYTHIVGNVHKICWMSLLTRPFLWWTFNDCCRCLFEKSFSSADKWGAFSCDVAVETQIKISYLSQYFVGEFSWALNSLLSHNMSTPLATLLCFCPTTTETVSEVKKKL